MASNRPARLPAENEPFVTGAAQFLADLPASDSLHACFVRSTVAHGDLIAVDTAAATSHPGVVAIFAATDLELPPFRYFEATPEAMARPPLASDRVRHVGDPIAVVVADSPAAAADAAELVVVEIDPLPALIDPHEAGRADALPLFPAHGTNWVFEPDEAPLEDVLADATVAAEERVTCPRVASAPLECSGILVRPDGDRLDTWVTSQGVHIVRDELAAALSRPPETLRVRSPMVGGGFGGRAHIPIEFVAVAAAADHLDRPVRWIETRTENLLTMAQGRGQVHDITVGLDADGLIVGVRARMVADAGAYPHMAPILAGASRRQCTGPYRVPRFDYRYGAVATNTPPVGAYRGAGQPEVTSALERAIDRGALGLGLDPAKVRRRNLLNPSDLPWSTGTGITIDSGDHRAALERALDLIGYDDIRRRQQAPGHPLVGIGLSCYSQTSGSGTDPEYGALTINDEGQAIITCGSPGQGQGHHSLWAEIADAVLGVGLDRVTVIDADSDAAPSGLTTGGSRTAQNLGPLIEHLAGDTLNQGRALAAERLEVDPADLVVGAGGLQVAGVPASLVSWADLAAAAGPDGVGSVRNERPSGPTHPYGTHVSVVEVDPDTGGVALVRHLAVDDCGVVMNPASVTGQQHGGSVSGIAPVLWEAMAWDGNGNPRTATFVDYLLPAASELPFLEVDVPAIPSTRNPVGARGIGENGCIAATAAVLNAVVDALRPLGVSHLDLPLTPEKVWGAIRDSGS
ncbi:MAG: xanthine dehydrogenase family protein [Actinomycetia bacterium]|nr:xanthine dehydrogenase family protein [Actinomycetes bacterium]